MRDLTTAEIEKILAKYPKAKRIAVENFLMTVGNNDNALCASFNLADDAQSYNWGVQTINAIHYGIGLAS